MVTQLLADGLVIGATYALIALGLTLIFGMMHVVNFAHGELYMLGGYFTLTLVRSLGLNHILAIPIAVVGVVAFGFVVERLLLRPIRGAPLLSSALITIGLSIFLQNTVLLIWGPAPAHVGDPFGGQVIRFGDVALVVARLFVIAAAVVVIVAVRLYIRHSKFGRAMRATFQDRDAAVLQGIDVDRVFAVTFMLGAGVAALAGALLSMVFVLSPTVGDLVNLKSFAVVILGGMGNIPGAVFGGFLLGVSESLGAGFISTSYKDGISFLLLILVLLVRPYGLLGRKEL